ncbi:hypothetical protein BIW11_04187 [Tropilaelaps mercedesae]|uniref:Uncharacterized protein n=1 Tax=Tropilaelaps mercedesae TaxID=418985 RepID=A0A1V9XA79_9ACAR|nr:hypothetical protein BIW11_04187 [Tropilaelaps mercedesae]
MTCSSYVLQTMSDDENGENDETVLILPKKKDKNNEDRLCIVSGIRVCFLLFSPFFRWCQRVPFCFVVLPTGRAACWRQLGGWTNQRNRRGGAAQFTHRLCADKTRLENNEPDWNRSIVQFPPL